MTDENYGICKSCRHCKHESEMPMCCGQPPEDSWVCKILSKDVKPEDGCERFRPGYCGVCNNYKDETCLLTGEEAYDIDVCPSFDPSGKSN